MKYISRYILAILLMSITPGAYSLEKPDDSTKVDFTWESIDWASAYEVEIKDKTGNIVLKRRVTENSIEFHLPPGNYSIRIGAYDRFEKLTAWSNWQKTEIRRKEAGRHSVFNLGIRVSLGMSYVRFLSSWDIPFENTYKAYTGKFGFNFGDFILFQPSKKIKYTGFMRYLGMEIEGNYIRYKGKEISGRPVTDMTGTYLGGNLFFTTNFDFPLNIVVRAGGGVVKSEFTYHTLPEKTSISSNDPYFKGGFSLEFSFLRYFFLETGVDYFVTSYIDFHLKSLRYYGMLGMRI